jgi:hypothetical protein
MRILDISRQLCSAILLAFLLSIGIFQAAGQDIYVSASNVSGTEDGSIDNPYNTIQEAANAAAPGKTIKVRGGVYREEVRIPFNGLTFEAYNNEVATINGAEVLTFWTQVGSSPVYRAIMNWDFLPDDGGNQVFVDQNMIFLSRWPDQTSGDIVKPSDAIAESVTAAGNIITITDNEFNEPDGLWTGAQVWINLSHNGADGQGWTGTVTGSSQANHTISVDFRGTPVLGDLPWGLGKNTEYYLFNPTPAAVKASGGVEALLSAGEWWKNADTLYIRTTNGNAPGQTDALQNVVEAKKRQFAFRPSNPLVNNSAITIRNFTLFATSITTDNSFSTRTKETAEDANNILLEGIKAKYVSHFTNHAGNFQDQWTGRSGIILNGTNNTMKNCTIQYSAGPAVCFMGYGIKILNNVISDANYGNTNSGAVNTGNLAVDCEIAYNTINNTPMIALSVKGFRNSNLTNIGVARIHHNRIYDFMRRGHDSGAIDQVGNDGQWTRIDHNVIYNTINDAIYGPSRYGIYLDFGNDFDGKYIVDHNLIYNVNVPILINHITDVLIYNNTGVLVNDPKIAIVNGNGGTGAGDLIRNNILGGTWNDQSWGSLKDALFEKNILDAKGSILTNLFVDTTTFNFQLKATASDAINMGMDVAPYNDPLVGLPDIGAFEYGLPAWKAGTPDVYGPTIFPNGGTFLDSIEVTLTADDIAFTIRYTLDGTDPDLTSPVYTLPFKLKDSTFLKARVYIDDETFSDISAASFSIVKYNLSLREADNPADVTPGLIEEYYTFPLDLNMEFLPDFDLFGPDSVNVVSTIKNFKVTVNDNFMYRYTGYIDIPANGVYTFFTTSDDGSKLFIGETEVVNNDGLHGPEEKSGLIGLKAGKHAITVIFFELGGGEALIVQYKGPGIQKAYIPAEVLYHKDYIARSAKVEISPLGGKFIDEVNVKMKCSTPGSTIYYTLDGTEPTTASVVYTDSLKFVSTTPVKAISQSNGLELSLVNSVVFEKSAAPVTVKPNGGTFVEKVRITLTCPTVGAEIYYTLDGSEPTMESLKYTLAFDLTSSATLKTIALTADLPQSNTSTATFIVAVANVTLLKTTANFCDSTTIGFACTTPGAVIRYTTDNTIPNETSTEYTNPVTIYATTNVRAIGFRAGLTNSAAVFKRYVKTATACATGVNEMPISEAILYPNPSSNGRFAVHFPSGISGNQGTVTIFDSKGKALHNTNLNCINGDTEFQSTYNLKPGLYFIEIITEKLQEHHKFIVQ